MAQALDHRCGSCARFVRVVEAIDETGNVRRAGECLLGVWPKPLYETNSCTQWVRRGEFRQSLRLHGSDVRGDTTRRATRQRGENTPPPRAPSLRAHAQITLSEDLQTMDAQEFRKVLVEVLRDELGVGHVEIAGRWEGGEMILKPGKEGVQEKRLPLDALFHKVVMIRDKLRVLEQKINGNPKLDDDEKVQLQQYVTGCYGSLTTFNVLFANREDGFVGQKGDE